MGVFLGYTSAYEYWRSYAAVPPSPRLCVPYENAETSAQSIRLALKGTSLDDGTLDVVVPGNRKSVLGVRFHFCSSEIGSPYVLVAPDLAMASPELTFLQMSQELSFARLVYFGSELCASYARDAFSSTGVSQREPLTIQSALLVFMNRRKGRSGVAMARKGIRLICENAASPREISSTLLLTMPFRYGGYGIPMPLLNYRIDVHKYDRTFAGKSFYRADMCWLEQKVIVEYDSDQWHTGAAKIAEDTRRRNAFIAMGFTVVGITNEQIKSATEMERIAFLVARLLGHRIRIRDRHAFEIRRDMLRAELLR